MLSNLVIATAKHAASGFATAPKPLQMARQAVCDSCDRLRGDRCTACGCGVKVKASWSSSDCPLGKWPAKPSMTCNTATEDLPVEEMAQLLLHAPPGPWPEGWAGWANVHYAHRMILDYTIANLRPYSGNRSGRGILSCVSAKTGMSSGKSLRHGYLPGAWVMASELRRHGCTLPITFAHLGPEEWDPGLTRAVEPLGVRVIDLRELERRDPMRILAGWETKVYAILHCGYEEVLFLDADNVPTRDPSFLFDWPEYREKGAIFWPDCPPPDARKEWLPEAVWRSIGMEYRPDKDIESGQLLINVRECWDELQICRFINEHSDYWYKMIFGDKSTFKLAWTKLETPFVMPDGPGWNGGALIQNSPDNGRPMFFHGCQNKPDLSGYPRPSCLPDHDAASAHIAELRKIWGGTIWHNYQPTEAEKKLAEELTGKSFIYRIIGSGQRKMTLEGGSGAGGLIGEGRADLEQRWEIFEGKLALCKSEKLTCLLVHCSDGTWRGSWIDYEKFEVELEPIP